MYRMEVGGKGGVGSGLDVVFGVKPRIIDHALHDPLSLLPATSSTADSTHDSSTPYSPILRPERPDPVLTLCARLIPTIDTFSADSIVHSASCLVLWNGKRVASMAAAFWGLEMGLEVRG